MSEKLGGYDWAAGRGERWLSELSKMEAMLAAVDAPLIAALALEAPCRLAEVGSGGGGTALAVARRAPAGSVVHGFDLSPPLVEAARVRARAEGASVVFEVRDMAQARPDQPYDRLYSRFGLMFFSEPPAAFANLRDWLVPRGRFAFAVWAAPTDNPWLTTTRDVLANIVDLPPLDADAPGAFRYADVEKLLVLLEHAGFGELEVQGWRGTLPMGGGLPAEPAAHFALAAFSNFGDLLAQAGDEATSRARQALTARFADHETNGAVSFSGAVHIVTGTSV